jgi:predicted transcriptional regulator
MSAYGDKMTEDISTLLFNLASADRLTLLSQIDFRKQRLTSLSKGINASAQECSRHLARLGEAGLIQDSDGLYEITPLGKGVQNLLTGLEFLLRLALAKESMEFVRTKR